ncbi:hypothetical protein A33M_0523 [Rhodovulum sp. PH10]|uniref:hypothetical protein n=1 Tax=Rhodovulum sp. PH10 TaxID=1187851 RepID=UPI00027C2AC2|nr:hypothetical protein [Rhodovulum sp. PH10]EJW10065.1 hypothetical protein A33M_0523 [Rhodovulum sp. PH10]
MFESLFHRWQTRLDAIVNNAIWSTVAGIAVLIAIVFGGAALFVWLEGRYGPIVTCLGFGGFFLLVAVIAVIVRAVLARRAERREVEIAHAAAQKTPPFGLDPRLLSSGIAIGRTIGGRRGLAIGLAGAFLVGMVLSRTVTSVSND